QHVHPGPVRAVLPGPARCGRERHGADGPGHHRGDEPVRHDPRDRARLTAVRLAPVRRAAVRQATCYGPAHIVRWPAWPGAGGQARPALTTLSAKSLIAASTAAGCSMWGKCPAFAMGWKWPFGKQAA